MCGRNLAKPRVFIVFVFCLFLARAMDLRLFPGRDYTFYLRLEQANSWKRQFGFPFIYFILCWMHIVWKRQSPAIFFIL